MKIANTVKVGGKTYNITITDDLMGGVLNCSAETDFQNGEIRISKQNPDKMKADFLHELMHTVYDHLGYKKHKEKKIDELANALHMVINDNPQIFME